MTMTIGAVRNVSFGDSAQDLINAEGKYTAQAPLEEIPADSFEKKSNKGAVTAGVTAAVLLAAAAGLGYAVSKGKIDLSKLKVAEADMKDIGFFKKAWAHSKNITATCLEKLGTAYDSVAKFFTKKADEVAKDAEKAVDEVEEIAEEAANKA